MKPTLYGREEPDASMVLHARKHYRNGDLGETLLWTFGHPVRLWLR